MLSNVQKETLQNRQKLSMSLTIVFLMLTSTLLAVVQDFSAEDETETIGFVEGQRIGQSIAQSTAQGGQGDWNGDHDPWHETGHPSITDLMWADPGVMSGIITDLSAIEALAPMYVGLLEESSKDDHDNDGINDLADLDDDNDGIYDLLERFDGCYGTHPFDHDND